MSQRFAFIHAPLLCPDDGFVRQVPRADPAAGLPACMGHVIATPADRLPRSARFAAEEVPLAVVHAIARRFLFAP